jgi:hypothetical protein
MSVNAVNSKHEASDTVAAASKQSGAIDPANASYNELIAARLAGRPEQATSPAPTAQPDFSKMNAQQLIEWGLSQSKPR